MGSCTIRLADRDKKRTQGIRRLSQKTAERWLYHVPVLDIPTPLPQCRECRSTHKARKAKCTGIRTNWNIADNRQAIWRDGDFLEQEATNVEPTSTAIGTILKKKNRDKSKKSALFGADFLFLTP